MEGYHLWSRFVPPDTRAPDEVQIKQRIFICTDMQVLYFF